MKKFILLISVILIGFFVQSCCECNEPKDIDWATEGTEVIIKHHPDKVVGIITRTGCGGIEVEYYDKVGERHKEWYKDYQLTPKKQQMETSTGDDPFSETEW